ncbi:MAG: NADH-quinone oxidoreductase subunit J [Deltaproteobacteria bacterium]|jgi:NADH-quinone oxidoreductase subunit J|nr:NADH-quinone oxidoreductase subunit J [Deltaproteobacteria bacterium]
MNNFLSELFQSLGSFLNEAQEYLAPWLPGQDLAALAAFAVYTLLILGGGLTAVLARNLVRAMMGLAVTFLGVSGMYLLLASPFLAFMQLLIYIGAVCVLIFFAVMLTRSTSDGQETRLPPFANIICGLLAAAAPLAAAGPLLYGALTGMPLKTPADTTADLGEGLLSADLVPFELISIILLAAMAGAVFLAWKGRQGVKS